ncbi:leucine carboxyl methyltransferase [Massarina eburnea CBS 473.64]|uniref:Leucine carboxyl methyltransferase 1 n=1 Tax=Massarina eburnea CBS 473.64 TaxID=1395130 RepID=A0A6A6RXJ4_9PLEO|nr:leucine carboxyl methyltransferase [Massarina eburnea CBS 473.64]
MAAKEIPDLRTLLGPRRGGGLRGRGGGRGGFGTSHEEKEAVRDSAVRGTDQDAAGSRVSCVELGYLDDPYAELFATQASTRRLPLLNRGTYVRTSAIDNLVDRFLTTSPTSPKQVISLGAGTDTRFFRLKDKYPNAQLIYHELDFSSNTTAKLHSIRKHSQLHQKLPTNTHPLSPQSDSYHSPIYNIHPLDLRSLAASSSDTPPPNLPNLDPSVSTLILSEMCLIYLQASTVSSILKTFLTHYLSPTTPASLILYEPILPHDAFGRTMISNLSTRNIVLPTLTAYPELGDQRMRLKQCGFIDGYKGADTRFIWRNWVSEEEKERVASLEMLDELEELELLLRHYCVAWGWRDSASGEKDVFSKAWEDTREQV